MLHFPAFAACPFLVKRKPKKTLQVILAVTKKLPTTKLCICPKLAQKPKGGKDCKIERGGEGEGEGERVGGLLDRADVS